MEKSENKDIPEALDLWEAMEKDYEVPPLPNILTM
jgi:hypothetical protein